MLVNKKNLMKTILSKAKYALFALGIGINLSAVADFTPSNKVWVKEINTQLEKIIKEGDDVHRLSEILRNANNRQEFEGLWATIQICIEASGLQFLADQMPPDVTFTVQTPQALGFML